MLVAELVPGKVPQGQRFFAVGGEFDGAGVVEDVSADQVVNGDDPEADFFQYQEAVVDVGCLCLIACEVSDSGFGQQLAQGKERLCVSSYVQECMNDILEQSADGLLHSDEGFAVLRVWGFQGSRKSFRVSSSKTVVKSSLSGVALDVGMAVGSPLSGSGKDFFHVVLFGRGYGADGQKFQIAAPAGGITGHDRAIGLVG